MKYASDQKFYFELTSLSASKIFDFDNFINVNNVKSNLSENKNNIDEIRKQIDNKSTVVETQTINNKEVQFKQVALEDVFNKKVIGNKNNQETQSNTKLQEENKKEKQEVIEIKPKVEIEQEAKLEPETKSKNKAKEEKQKPKDEAKTKDKKSKQQEQEILVDEKLDELNNFENNKDNKKVSILDALLNKSFKTNNYKLSQVKHNFNAQTKIKPETIVDANEISEHELKHNFKDGKNDNKVSKKNKDNNSSQASLEPNLFTLDFGDNSDNDYLVQPKVELKQEEIKSPTKKEDKEQISKQKEKKQQNNSDDKKTEVKDELDLELEKKLKILSSGVDREKLFFQIADNKNNDNKTKASQVLDKIKKSVTINADDVYFKEAKNILLTSNNGMILLFENEVSAKNLNVVSMNPKFLVYLKNTFGKIYRVIGMTTQTASDLTEKYKQHLKTKKKLNDVEINDLIDKANKSNTTMKDLAISILGDEIEEE